MLAGTTPVEQPRSVSTLPSSGYPHTGRVTRYRTHQPCGILATYCQRWIIPVPGPVPDTHEHHPSNLYRTHPERCLAL